MNNVDHDTKEAIVLWLIHNQSFVKQILETHLKVREYLINSENVYFKDDIIKESNDYIKREIVSNVTNALAVAAEPVYTVLETINIDDYLKL